MHPLPDFLLPLERLTIPFPREAVAATIAQPEAATPFLLHALEWAEQHPDEANAKPFYMLHLFAAYLLAQFREVRAYPLVIRLIRHPQAADLLGDMMLEAFGRIIASVFDGNLEPIHRLIEDPSIDQFNRATGTRALGVLVHTGRLPRAELSAYLGELLDHRLEREPSFAWDSVVELCTDLGFAEHREAIRAAYAADYCSEQVDALSDVEAELDCPPGKSERTQWQRYTLIDDAIAAMQNWSCFKTPEQLAIAEKKWRSQLAAAKSRLAELNPISLARPFTPSPSPKIGRNDQCPCGSGKKYKKCCG